MKTHSTTHAAPRLLAAVVLAACLCACAGESAESLLATAKQSLAKGDAKAATIQLKNALNKNADLAEARYLLGKALLEGGSAGLAEIELVRARDKRYSLDDVMPLLLESLIVRGMYDKVIDEASRYPVLGAAARSKVDRFRAQALLASGKLDKAREVIGEMLKAEPGNPEALLLSARTSLIEGNLDKSLATVDQVLEKRPDHAQALKLRGDFLRAKGDLAGAAAALKKVVQIEPAMSAAHGTLILIHLQRNSVEDAKAQLESMKRTVPYGPSLLYASAIVAFMTGDFKGTRENCQQLLRGMGDDATVLQMAGAAEYSLGAYAQAEEYLRRAVKANDKSVLSRRFLALVHLEQGLPKKATAVIEPVLGAPGIDAETLAVAGKAFLESGDLERAEKLFDASVKLDPKDAGKRVNAALVRVARGEVEDAIAELESVSKFDQGIVADMALLTTALRRKEYDRAMRTIARIEQKRPNDGQVKVIKGEVLRYRGDVAGARGSFEAALAVNPALLSASTNLADLDILGRKPENAVKRYETAAAAAPSNSAPLLSLAALKASLFAPDTEVESLISKAVSIQPTDLQARIDLVNFYMRIGDPKRAMAVAQDALVVIPDNVKLTELLGLAQSAAGQPNQALSTFSKLSIALPGSAMPYLRMEEVHLAAKNVDMAIDSLRKAIDADPQSVEGQRRLIYLLNSQNRTDEAVQLAKAMQRRAPALHAGYIFEGDVAALRGQWAQAVDAFSRGLEKTKAMPLAMRLHGALLAAGKPGEADKLAAVWLKGPDAFMFRRFLAESALRRGRFDEAIEHFQQQLKVRPDDPEILNNLAMSYFGGKKSGAVEYAERANKMAPNQPMYMDTLAVILADSGDLARATDVASRAVLMVPGDANIRFNFARMLVKAGRNDEAKKHLSELAKLGSRFPNQAEVRKLLEGL